MKKRLSLLVAAALLPLPLLAGTAPGPGYSKVNGNGTVEETPSAFPFELTLEGAYVGGGNVKRGERVIRDLEEVHTLARFIYTPRIAVGILRLGVGWERFSFDLPDRIGGNSTRIIALSYPGPVFGPVPLSRPQIPDTLQSVTATIGLDTRFSEAILVRFEAQPGFYGTDDLDGDTFNVPFILGGTYVYSSDLQFIVGVSVDYERKYPVFPGLGVRWRFGPQWVLDAVMPTPRLVFEATRNLSFYAGASLRGSTHRTGEGFGDARGDRRLNKAVVSYSEIRTGAGMEWKITPDIRLTAEGGYLPYREFDYHRANVRYRPDGGAAYGMFSLRAAF
ncbi:hypothetical protein BH20VER1_BH20VER1_23490 [soil metagenome]